MGLPGHGGQSNGTGHTGFAAGLKAVVFPYHGTGGFCTAPSFCTASSLQPLFSLKGKQGGQCTRRHTARNGENP